LHASRKSFKLRVMATSHSDLPSDVASLRALVAQQRQYIESLEEALRLIRHRMFGRKSEATPREQLGLFNEAEAILDGKRLANRVREQS
jgi:hypothetical protein